MTTDPPASNAPFPVLTVPCARLEPFNATWSRRRKCFADRVGGNWWGRGTIISPDLRALYNSYMPIEEYCHDLAQLARQALGDSRFVPQALTDCWFESIPDLWATLEEPFEAKTTFSQEQLLPLFCNIAEPSRMGTAAGRYPQQLQHVHRLLAGTDNVRILDLGCGVGLGTCELAAAAASVCNHVETVGVTSEALEVWMATNRKLPHTPWRESQFHATSCPTERITFKQGRAQEFDDGSTYHLIVCNGLAGGRFLNRDIDIIQFLRVCRRALRPKGTVLLSNHFHQGSQPGVQRLMNLAEGDGWTIEGTWQDLILTRIDSHNP